MNKVIMMGRLTRDPEVRYLQNQNSTAVARFSIAVDRRYKREGEPDADFFNCTAFGKQAEFVEKYLRKGIKAQTKTETAAITPMTTSMGETMDTATETAVITATITTMTAL